MAIYSEQFPVLSSKGVKDEKKHGPFGTDQKGRVKIET